MCGRACYGLQGRGSHERAHPKKELKQAIRKLEKEEQLNVTGVANVQALLQDTPSGDLSDKPVGHWIAATFVQSPPSFQVPELLIPEDLLRKYEIYMHYKQMADEAYAELTKAGLAWFENLRV